MENMKRADFLKLGAAAALAPLYGDLFSRGERNSPDRPNDEELLRRLGEANDRQVAKLLESVRPGNLEFSRKTAYDFAVLAGSYCFARSRYYHSREIADKLELLVAFLSESQSADGTVNVGNLESPPDTAFVMEIICTAAGIMKRDGSAELVRVNEDLKKFILKAGEGLVAGGVHTPNHRWVICAALSGINHLFPNKRYVERIDDWLAEGVYMDKDGHYPERSGTYSAVENTAFITMARLLNRPKLLEPVRKNLQMMYYYMEPDGDFVSFDSRRQDQYLARHASLFYLQYRYMATHDNSPMFAAIAKRIETMKGFDTVVLDRSLFYFLENERLQRQLPAAEALPVDFEKLFSSSHLLRIRRNDTTVTLFGGVDWPLIIASGRSNSPNFFSYRSGGAILRYMRLSSEFFSTGYFYSDGLKKDGDKYTLFKKLRVPYYQPLPKEKRNASGDYRLSPSTDGRFWNKMDFSNRPESNVKTLGTRVALSEKNGNVELEFHVSGMDKVPVTIELCFAEAGRLRGVKEAGDDNYFLESGFGEYEFGGNGIRFGPGSFTHKAITNLEGERYGTHFGSLRTAGMHVFITGMTPFNHKMTFSGI